MVKVILKRLFLVAGLLGSGVFGFLIGQETAESPKVRLVENDHANDTLCTFHPIYPEVRDIAIKFDGRVYTELAYLIGWPQMSPEWMGRYRVALDHYTHGTTISGDTFQVPCHYFNDLDLLMTVTHFAGNDEWLKEDGWTP